MEASIRTYNKTDAVMTRGYAILSMVVLHMFCCLGPDVQGSPLIWLSDTKPLVYCFGFFAEICVPTYSMCVGYAQMLQYENNSLTHKLNLKRIFKLMINYWTILCIFSIIGLIMGNQRIPANAVSFIKSIFLLHSYNGTWWYLNTYVLLLLLPFAITLIPVKRINIFSGIVICFAIDAIWYLLGRFGYIPDVISANAVVQFIYKECKNLIDVLPYFWIGAFLCKEQMVTRLSQWANTRWTINKQKTVVMSFMLILFVLASLAEKAVLMGPIAVAVFLLFNTYPMKNGGAMEKTFIFLGKHSTNIWLSHMFFWSILFPGLIQQLGYPLLMLVCLLLLCIITSYIEMGIQRLICK